MKHSASRRSAEVLLLLLAVQATAYAQGTWDVEALANALFKGGVPLARVTGQGVEKGEAWATFESKAPIVKAELNFTKDAGKWQPRKWESVRAKLEGHRASAAIPEGATAFYLNLFDDRGLAVSAEHLESK